MRARLLFITVVAGLLAALPMAAHHSFSSEYDNAKPLNFEKVTVTNFEWTNPHARFYVNVKEDPSCTANCKVTNWNFELASPNVLKRQGWTRNSLKEGDIISVKGAAAKDGSHLGNAQTVTLSDGTRVGARSAADPQ